MSFLIHSISNSNVVPMEYYPCVTKAVVGTPMVMLDGALVEWGVAAILAGTSGIPIYISMGVKSTSDVENFEGVDTLKRIPVIRVRDDIVFEATSESNDVIVGDMVDIASKSSTAGTTDYDYFIKKVDESSARFQVIEAKNTGSTAQKVLIRYIG